jgi:hypothetical protein
MSMNLAMRRKTMECIEIAGHAIVCTILDQPPYMVPLSYTIGLTSEFGFEVIIFGLRPESAKVMLNSLAARLRDYQEFNLDVPDDRFSNFPVMFKKCNQTVHEYVVQADEFYGKEIPVIQMILSDRNGRFPGDKDYDHAYMDARQKILY